MPCKALVVDDDHFMREVLSELLTKGGYQVLLATDGDEGCRVAREQHPDVIILDVVMPRMDGIEACRTLRASSEFHLTPIILMTSRSDIEGRVNPFQVGADDYLAKPFEGFELLARLNGNLAKRRTIESLERKTRETETLLQVTESVTSGLDGIEILRQLNRRITKRLQDALHCSLFLLQQNDHFGYVLTSSDNLQRADLALDLNQFPPLAEVARTCAPRLIDVSQSNALLTALCPDLPRENFNTCAILPMVRKGRAPDLMMVRTLRSRPGMAQDELAFCQMVTNLSAGALKNAWQFARVCKESEILRCAKKQLEDELRIKSIYQKLFENVSEGLAAFNREGRIVFVNRKGLEVVGHSRENLERMNFIRLLDRESIQNVVRFRRRMETGAAEADCLDVAIRTGTGDRRHLSVSFAPQPIENDLRVVAFRDVTESRRAEEELIETKKFLEEANEHLKKLDRNRSEFLNTAAHELRVPITIISGYCSLLHEMGIDNFTSEQKECLDATIESTGRLIDLINNMLDLSRLNAGKMQMLIGENDLCGLAHEVSRDLRSLTARNSLTVEVEAPEECRALFDSEKIKRVLLNLVGNAIKFTPPGGRILIRVTPRPEEVVVTVEDTGKGIPPDRISELFKEFIQLDPDHAGKGTGLGLSICKKIVEAHHGRIWADSIPGTGSNFSFALPRPA